DRADAERHARELPEVGHQPRVWIGAQSAGSRDLLAKAVELLLGEAALEVGARVVARRRVPLEVDEIAGEPVSWSAPEVVEADLVQRRERLERGDVTAELG